MSIGFSDPKWTSIGHSVLYREEHNVDLIIRLKFAIKNKAGEVMEEIETWNSLGGLLNSVENQKRLSFQHILVFFWVHGQNFQFL